MVEIITLLHNPMVQNKTKLFFNNVHRNTEFNRTARLVCLENQKGTRRWLWISWTRIPVENSLQLLALVDKGLPQHQHIAEPVDRHVGRSRGRHVRERGPEGGQDPGVDPVGLRQFAACLGEVPGLAGIDHANCEAPVMKRLQERPVHPARGLDDDPFRPAVPEDAGDLSEAVRVVGGGVVLPVEINVEQRPHGQKIFENQRYDNKIARQTQVKFRPNDRVSIMDFCFEKTLSAVMSASS